MSTNDTDVRIPYDMIHEDSGVLIEKLTLHIGSILVLEDALQALKTVDPVYAGDIDNSKFFLMSVDQLGLHDSKPWTLLKEVCDHKIEDFVLLVRAYDLGLTTREDIQEAIQDGR